MIFLLKRNVWLYPEESVVFFLSIVVQKHRRQLPYLFQASVQKVSSHKIEAILAGMVAC